MRHTPRRAAVALVVPCVLALAACFGDEGIHSPAGTSSGTGSGTSSGTGDAPTGGSGGGSTTGGAASPDCDAYLECVLEATPDAYGGAVAVYGPNSDCRNSTPQVAEDCEQACRAARSNLHESYPDVAACGEGEPATTGSTAGHTVSGSVVLVNAGDVKGTSVILAPTASFSPDLPHSTAPDGAKVMAEGPWSIADVPDGTYWLLVAHEDDGLVVDAEGFDGPPMVVVAGADVMLEATKVTAAISGVSPTGGALVGGEPAFSWTDEASEDGYVLQVIDETGVIVWDTAVPAADGVGSVELKDGDLMLPDGSYQFRVAAIKGVSVFTRTEDLAGNFVVKNF